MLTITPIQQEHCMGCGVACVAFRRGISYTRALASFTNKAGAWTYGYQCEEITEALAQGGLTYEWERFSTSRHSKFLTINGTIVFVEPSETYPSGHYLIRSRRGWMNPWLNFPKMVPVIAGFQRSLPGKASYIIFSS